MIEPIDPPRAQNEFDTLRDFLDYYRAVLVRKAEALSDEQLNTHLAPSTLTIGGLVYHMALVEDTWFTDRFANNGEPEPWASAPWDDDRDWDFTAAKTRTGQQILAQFADSVGRSRAVVANADSLEQLSAVGGPSNTPWNLRWILVHMIEEYARHCGHADLIRESIDGVTGD